MHEHICTRFLRDPTTFHIYIHIILNYVLFGHYADKIRNRMMDTEDSRLKEDFE